MLQVLFKKINSREAKKVLYLKKYPFQADKMTRFGKLLVSSFQWDYFSTKLLGRPTHIQPNNSGRNAMHLHFLLFLCPNRSNWRTIWPDSESSCWAVLFLQVVSGPSTMHLAGGKMIHIVSEAITLRYFQITVASLQLLSMLRNATHLLLLSFLCYKLSTRKSWRMIWQDLDSFCCAHSCLQNV